MQVSAELGGGRGDADLGAEAGQHLGHLRGGEQLVGPVRVCLSAGHRDVPGAQFLRQIRQHARLQVAAHEHAGPVAVPDRLVPVLRRERRVEHMDLLLTGLRIGHRPAVLVEQTDPVGDVVTGQHRVLADVIQQLQHAAVRAGRLQIQHTDHRQHRRPVLAQMPGHQRDMVVAVRRPDRVDTAQLLRETARRLDRLTGHLQRRGVFRRGRAQRIEVLQDLPVVDDQRLGDLLLLLLQLLQLYPGTFRQRRDPPAEHLRRVVTGLLLRGVDHRRQDRDALLVPVVTQHRGVAGLALTGEVGDLRSRDPLPPGPRVTEAVDPPQMLDLQAVVRPRRPRRGPLQPVVIAPGPRPAGEEHPVQPGHPRRADTFKNQREDRRVDLLADLRGHVVQRRVRRKLERTLDQLLQRHVNQVGRIVLTPGRLPDRRSGHRPRRRHVRHDFTTPPDQRPMRLRTTVRVVHRGDVLTQPQIPADVDQHRLRNILQAREIPHPVETLQLHHERQQMAIRTGLTTRPRDLLRLRRVEHVQLPGRQEPLEPRIRGPLDRRHANRPRPTKINLSGSKNVPAPSTPTTTSLRNSNKRP